MANSQVFRGVVMDELLRAFSQSLATEGDAYVLTIGLIAILAWVAAKIVPYVSRYVNKRLEIEEAKEKRSESEVKNREQRDRERSSSEGRWLEQYEQATRVQEQTNTVIASIKEQMEALNNTNKILVKTLDSSKERSEEMSKKVDQIYNNTRKGC